MSAITIPSVQDQTAWYPCSSLWYVRTLGCKLPNLNSNWWKHKGDCTVSCHKQASGLTNAGPGIHTVPAEIFLSPFPVLTSWSGRLLPRLGKLASSTSRFLSYQLHYPNERRGSIPSSCTNMPGIDTHWCGLGHMTIPKQGGVAKELSTLAKPGSYAHRGPMDKQGWNGLTKEIWVLLLEKERTSAAKPTVCLCLKTGIASFHRISHCLGSFS